MVPITNENHYERFVRKVEPVHPDIVQYTKLGGGGGGGERYVGKG